MFTANGDLEDQDHLKHVILKIKIRSPKQRDLEDQDQITILILRSQSDLEDQDHAHLWPYVMFFGTLIYYKVYYFITKR